jgi:integrase/recombinase XerD
MYARDIWLFGYYCNGINTKDIALLRYKNIDDGFIEMQREKTKNTTRSNPKIITIPISEEIVKIIDRWGNKDKSPNNYIFPILKHGLSPHRMRELVQGFTSLINDWMKKIAQNLGINKKITTIVYRHSFSTILKRSGVSTEFISEALGHTDLRTTENYLDSFEKETKKKFAKKLTDFNLLEPVIKP